VTANPILEELWQVKDALAREAGDDFAWICDATRRWAADHPLTGPPVEKAAEVPAWIYRQEEQKREEIAPRMGGQRRHCLKKPRVAAVFNRHAPIFKAWRKHFAATIRPWVREVSQTAVSTAGDLPGCGPHRVLHSEIRIPT